MFCKGLTTSDGVLTIHLLSKGIVQDRSFYDFVVGDLFVFKLEFPAVTRLSSPKSCRAGIQMKVKGMLVPLRKRDKPFA
jgi:hypothetical protein